VGVVSGTVLFRNISINPVAGANKLTGKTTFSDDFSDPKLSKWRPATGVDRVPTDEHGHALRIIAGEHEAGTYTTPLGPLTMAPEYTVSTEVRAEGLPYFKIAIAWIDKNGRTISSVPDWPEWTQYGRPFVPATISLWHPRKGNAIDLQFVTAPRQTIDVVTRNAQGTIGRTILADYVPGKTYEITLVWNHARSAAFRVVTPDGKVLRYTIDRKSGFGLFRDPFVNLSIKASAPHGATSVVRVSHAKLFIPAQTRYALNVSDIHLTWLTYGILAWLAAYLALRASALARLGWLAVNGFTRLLRLRTVLIAAGIAGLCVAYSIAALADGHPFDRLSQESAGYVMSQYGVGALYGRTTAVPDAAVRGAAFPWNPAEFVYPPGLGNFFAVVSKTWQLAGGTISPLHNRSYYIFYKLAFTFFILVAAGLILGISRRTKASRRWAWLMVALFALSPAVIFDAPVWGQSNALLSAALLLALLALITDKPRLMWSSIIVALLLKQTALLVVPLIAVFALRRFGLRRTFVDACFGLVVGFAFISPFVLAGIHPSTAFTTTIEKLIDFGSPLTQYDTQVSADTFPIWVLFTGFSGLQGHDRLWASDHGTIGLLNITYASAGLLLFCIIVCVGVAVAWLAARGRTPSYQRLFLAMALVIVAYVSMNTRTSGHYLTLALPYLLLGLPRGARPLQFWKFGAVTATAVLSIYGLYMFIAAHGEWPNFIGLGSPSTNVISAIVYRIYISDVFITLFAALLLYVMAHLLVEVLQRPVTPSARISALREPQLELVTAR
jgi:hypothetical protein